MTSGREAARRSVRIVEQSGDTVEFPVECYVSSICPAINRGRMIAVHSA